MLRNLSLVCLLCLLAAPASAQTYKIVDLGTLGGPMSQARGVNAAGWVVGESMTQDVEDHAFLYRDGRMQDLGVAGAISSARAVNAAGQVVGFRYGSGFHAFFSSSDQKPSDIGTLGGGHSTIYAINAAGHATGSSYTKNLMEHAFLWDGRAMTDLGTLGGAFSTARGINASDEVVGWAYLAKGRFHAFAGGASGLRDLGTLGGDYSTASAVNDAGAIVGSAYLAGNTMQHACLWLADAAHDLGGLGGNYAEALALDGSASRIVGKASVPSKTGYVTYHAFVWSAGAMRDLNDLLPQGSGWVLEEATGVNDAGQIVGTGTIAGQRRAFLLEPSTPAAAPTALPTQLVFAGAAPNPARASARFSYALPRAGQVSLRIVDVAGRLVRDLAHEWQAAGTHDLTWDLADGAGRRVGSGVYYARLALGSEARTSAVQVLH